MILSDVVIRDIETFFVGEDLFVRGIIADKKFSDSPKNRVYWQHNLGNSKKISTHGKGPEEF